MFFSDEIQPRAGIVEVFGMRSSLERAGGPEIRLPG
jgi:hypothetical protein